MLAAFTMSTSPPEEQARVRKEFAANKDDPMAAGSLGDFAAWQQRNFQRLAYRAAWQRYFRDVDVFRLPRDGSAGRQNVKGITRGNSDPGAVHGRCHADSPGRIAG